MKTKPIAVIVAALICPPIVLGQVPPGFELVKVTQELQYYDASPSINNAGQVVFTTLFGLPWSNSEIFLYDNGKVQQITDNEDRDVGAVINDAGMIAWCGGVGSGGCARIYRYADGVTTLISANDPYVPASLPSINDLGHIAWVDDADEPCGGIRSIVRLYDGQ